MPTEKNPNLKVKTHKLGTKNGAFAFSLCGRALHLFGGLASMDWDEVDCKRCLNRRKNKNGKKIKKRTN